MADDTIAYEIKNPKASQGEGIVNGVWGAILLEHFPSRDGYPTFPEAPTNEGYIDLLTRRTVFHPGEKTERHPILVTQGKRTGREGESWAKWQKQASDYWGSILTARGTYGIKGRHFVIIAVGRKVTFYEWHEKGEVLDIIGTPEGTPLRIDRQCATVTRRIQYIRDHSFS